VTQKTATIFYDTTGPTVTLFAASAGAAATNQQAVSLNCAAADGGSGVAQMRFSNNGSSWSAWEGYSSLKTWTLSAGEEEKTVYGEFRDAAGNVTQKTDDIIYDSLPPVVATFEIDGGAPSTTSHSVTLSIDVSDGGSGMSEMRFSNDGASWSPWENYASTKPSWNLAAGTGTRWVYAEFTDIAGNTQSAGDSIQVDP